MKTIYRPRFVKDLKAIRSQPEYNEICQIVFDLFSVKSDLSAIPNVKKIKNSKECYRVRVGNYRINFSFSKNEVLFMRVLHRKDICRYFP